MKVVKVVCGVIWKGDKVFIARRKPEKMLGGYWEFPGGKIEEGEEPEKALTRELKEELGMEIEIGQYLGHNFHTYETASIELIAYECKYKTATFKLTDHDEWIFVSHAALHNYIIAPADVFFINIITNKIDS